MNNPFQDALSVYQTANSGPNKTSYIKRVAAALLILLAICVPALLSGVKANAEVSPSTCGTPELFVFPNKNVAAGTTVTIFVTESNQTATTNPFIVQTSVVGPTGGTLTSNSQVISVTTHGVTNFTVSFPTTAATVAGTYTVTALSQQGSVLPAVAEDFCNSAQTTFTVACNSNDCTEEQDSNR
jgi:hypothetical protein